MFFYSLLFLFFFLLHQKRQELIIRMEQTFNLSTLTKFLHQTLAFTEEVKNVLKSNCDEAIFSLKPWHKEIITKQDVSKNACIFSNVRQLIVILCIFFYNQIWLICSSLPKSQKLASKKLQQELVGHYYKHSNYVKSYLWK